MYCIILTENKYYDNYVKKKMNFPTNTSKNLLGLQNVTMYVFTYTCVYTMWPDPQVFAGMENTRNQKLMTIYDSQWINQLLLINFIESGIKN